MELPQKRDAALAALKDVDPQRRLEAARLLRALATAEDDTEIRRALSGETVKWVRQELEDVLAILEEQTDSDVSATSPSAPDAAYTAAVRSVTRQVVHELRHFLARFELGLDELDGYHGSVAEREFARMSDFVDTVFDLGTAAGSPKYETFDLASVLLEVAEDQAREVAADIDLAGSRSLLCVGDRRLVELTVANVLRNAVEATNEVRSLRSPSPVVVNWGKTATEYWVSVIDDGLGPPIGLRRFFRMGMTTKPGHMGMGLTVALQAVQTFGGRLIVTAREENGTCFELRWPIPAP